MLVDHVPFFPLGLTTALPKSNSGFPSLKTSSSSPSSWSLIYAAASNPHVNFKRSFTTIISYSQVPFAYYSDASPAAECLLCCRRCFEVGCGFARDVPFVAKPFFFNPSINTLSPLLWKCCFRELWSMCWLQQSQHLLVLKFQAASLKG